MENKDLYKILGLDNTATKEEIKKAFKSLSQKKHPDKGGDEEEYSDIAQAYYILSNHDRKQQYDNTGSLSGKPTMESQVNSHIASLFKYIIDGERFQGNIIDECKEQTKAGIIEVHEKIKSAKNQNRRLVKQLNRVTTTSNNLFESLLTEKIKENDSHLENLDHTSKLLQEIKSRLDKYQDNGAQDESINSGLRLNSIRFTQP